MKYKLEGAGKGDAPRPIDKKAYDETWERVFGKKKKPTINKKKDSSNQLSKDI